MAWSSNLSSVIASLEAKAQEIDEKAAIAAEQGRTIGVQNIQALLVPGHGYKTGTLSEHYDLDSTTEKKGEGHYGITWTSKPMNNGYCYQPIAESRVPHAEPGIQNAVPLIVENTKQIMEG